MSSDIGLRASGMFKRAGRIFIVCPPRGRHQDTCLVYGSRTRTFTPTVCVEAMSRAKFPLALREVHGLCV